MASPKPQEPQVASAPVDDDHSSVASNLTFSQSLPSDSEDEEVAQVLQIDGAKDEIDELLSSRAATAGTPDVIQLEQDVAKIPLPQYRPAMNPDLPDTVVVDSTTGTDVDFRGIKLIRRPGTDLYEFQPWRQTLSSDGYLGDGTYTVVAQPAAVPPRTSRLTWAAGFSLKERLTFAFRRPIPRDLFERLPIRHIKDGPWKGKYIGKEKLFNLSIVCYNYEKILDLKTLKITE